MTAVTRVCLAAPLFAATHSLAQLSPYDGKDTTELKGRIVSDGPARIEGLAVELFNLTDHTFHMRNDIASDGTFVFRSIPGGDYEVKVITIYGDDVTSTIASAGRFNEPVEIRLPEQKRERPVSGTVPVQELEHPLSKQARKLLDGVARPTFIIGHAPRGAGGNRDRQAHGAKRIVSSPAQRHSSPLNLAATTDQLTSRDSSAGAERYRVGSLSSSRRWPRSFTPAEGTLKGKVAYLSGVNVPTGPTASAAAGCGSRETLSPPRRSTISTYFAPISKRTPNWCTITP